MNPLSPPALLPRLRASLLPLLLCLANGAGAAIQVGSLTLHEGLAYGPAPAPLAGCEIGKVDASPASWLEANGASTNRRHPGTSWIEASYAEPVQATAARAVLSRDALRQLAEVAVRDQRGEWHTTWSGTLLDPVIEGCERVWFAQPLTPDGMPVRAIRFTFRSATGALHVSSAQLLPAAR